MKKNNTAIIIVVVVVLLVLAGAAYHFMRHSNMSPTQSNENANSQMQQITSGKKSLFDFFSMGGSQKCTFTNTTNGGGTIYVSSGKMRGDFQETNNSTGKTAQTHMINDGTYVYIWTDGQTNGYKMSDAVMKQEESQPTQAPSTGSQPQPSQGMDMHQQMNTSCGGWTADASMFTVPTNVTFTDYSSMMQGASTGATTMHTGAAPMQGTSAECAECNQAPAGAARNQCLAALHCK